MTVRPWFTIPELGIVGDRTIEQQAHAVRPALEEAKGKTVLDVGCAEALLTREFARAGAERCVGLELLREHLEIAEKVCKGFPIELRQQNMNDVQPAKVAERFDIVLALGILHKLRWPGEGARWVARSCAGLLLFRAKGGVHDGLVRSKHFVHKANVHDIFREEGLEMDRVVQGLNDEQVEYWRRA